MSLVIGIAGGTASGKSTVADAVARRLGATCLHLHHDRYYRSAHAETNFDHPDSLDTARLVTDLHALRRGVMTTVPRYDFATHSRLTEEDLVEPRPVILVEGILVFCDPELRALMDHRFFVDAPDDLRFQRRLHRDVAERGRTPEGVAAQYEATVRPMYEAFVRPSAAYAEAVLDGTAPVDGLVSVVMAVVGARP